MVNRGCTVCAGDASPGSRCCLTPCFRNWKAEQGEKECHGLWAWATWKHALTTSGVQRSCSRNHSAVGRPTLGAGLSGAASGRPPSWARGPLPATSRSSQHLQATQLHPLLTLSHTPRPLPAPLSRLVGQSRGTLAGSLRNHIPATLHLLRHQHPLACEESRAVALK